MNNQVQSQSSVTSGETPGNKQTFETVADPANLGRIVEFVEQFLDKLGVKGETRGHVCVAVDEIVTNVVMYAYPGEKGPIRITIERQNDRIMIAVVDSGIPFNPLNHPAPDVNASIEKRLIGGLGIHLTRNMMDKLDYRRIGATNRFTMIKNIGGKND